MKEPHEIRDRVTASIDILLSETVRSIIPTLGPDVQDAVTVKIGTGHPKRYRPRTGVIEDFVYQRLGHYAANLSHRHAVAGLSAAYAYPTSPTSAKEKESSGRAVNRTHKAQEELMKELIDEAVAQGLRAKGLTNEANPDRLGTAFVLTGDQGVGKTLFLNHLCFEFQKLREESGVVWARLNLSKDLGDIEKFDVPMRVLTKLTAVLIRFHHRKNHTPDNEGHNNFLDVFQRVQEKIDERAGTDEQRQFLTREWHSTWERYSMKPFLRTEPVHETLSKYALEAASDAKLSILLVLDGLDQLDRASRSSKRFKLLLRQVRDLFERSDKGMCILAVCRERSYKKVIHFIDRHRHPDHEHLKVTTPTLTEIVNARKKAIILELKGMSADEDNTYEGVDNAEIALWETRLNSFSQSFEPDEIESLIDNQNRRDHMQIVRLQFLDWLNSRRLKSYKLVERITLAGHNYPPRYFKYERSADGECWKKDTQDHVALSDRFLPCLFSPPNLGLRTSEVGIKNEDGSILLALRIIQFVMAFQRTGKKGLRVADVGRALEIFGYPISLVVRQTEELDDFQILECYSRDLIWTSSIERSEVRALGKARAILRVAFGDIAYLSLAAMRMPLPDAALKRNRPIVVATSADFEDHTDFKYEWVRTKIINATAAIRILRAANEAQRRQFSDGSKALVDERLMDVFREAENPRDRDLPGMFDFVDGAQIAVRDHARAAFSSLDTAQAQRLADDLDGYINEWRDA